MNLLSSGIGRTLIGKLSIADKINIATKQRISQDSLNNLFTSLSVNEITKLLSKNNASIEIDPSMIDKMKTFSPNINFNKENKEKFAIIAKKLNMSDEDINEIKENFGKINKPFITLNDIQNSFSVTEDISPSPEIPSPKPKPKIDKVDLPNISDDDVSNNVGIVYKTIKNADKGHILTEEERLKYEKSLSELKNLDDSNPNKEEVEKYLEKIKDNINVDDVGGVELGGNKTTIIDFTKYASLFRYCLVLIITICIIIYIIIVILSFINVVYLLIKIINTIISLFYNTVLTNEQTLSYNAKQIVKSTNNNFKYDIFNILTEQKTALTIFNSVIYIIYILMAYVIMYLLCVIYVQMMKYTHVLKGSLSDIDEKYKILPIIGLLLIFSIFHLLIYKFIFKNMAISNFKEITKFETDVDVRISNIIETKYNNNDECSKFFDLLTDTSKRNELDTYFSNKVKTIKVDNENSIRKYLMMYNIYMYFEEYLYMNDVMKEKIKNYFGISKDENGDEVKQDTTFIGLLDSNERKLLKLYHEDLPFHTLISKDYLEDYQKVNEEISLTINAINKYIIKYTGTFFPFLITCIYIFLICIYNIYTLYIIFKFIIYTEEDDYFISFIYTFSHKYIIYCEKIYSFFFSK